MHCACTRILRHNHYLTEVIFNYDCTKDKMRESKIRNNYVNVHFSKFSRLLGNVAVCN